MLHLGHFSEAEKHFERALQLDPHCIDAHTNLGSAFKERGQLAEAMACHELALTYDPDSVTTHWNRSLTWLQMGNFEQGWPEYEWRWKRKEADVRRYSAPRWDGSSLKDRTILCTPNKELEIWCNLLVCATC